MVIVLPAPEALAMLRAPVRPLSDVTPPPPPGQAAKAGAPAVDCRQRPGLPAVTDVRAPVPLPTITPLAVSEVAPVPPLLTLRAVPRARAPVILRSPFTVMVVPLSPRRESAM